MEERKREFERKVKLEQKQAEVEAKQVHLAEAKRVKEEAAKSRVELKHFLDQAVISDFDLYFEQVPLLGVGHSGNSPL
jgi:hypothetical protein